MYLFSDVCPGEVASFEGKKGVFIIGQIKPKLAGVQIIIVSEDNSQDKN